MANKNKKKTWHSICININAAKGNKGKIVESPNTPRMARRGQNKKRPRKTKTRSR